MRIDLAPSLESVARDDWNALHGTQQPFLRHEFLDGLERHRCVDPELGWQPMHILVTDQHGLLAAVPAYLKSHSWGEFVFDWAWADAYERQGLPYYPKWIAAIPFTPVTGPRLLMRADADLADVLSQLQPFIQETLQEQGWSSFHWLFPDAALTADLERAGNLRRTGCQFHWHNQSYRDFEDFLDQLSAKKRKNIRRERRLVEEQGIRFSWLSGDSLSEAALDAMHAFYDRTCAIHGNMTWLKRDFLFHLAEQMPESLVLIMASGEDGGYRAGAWCFQDTHRLYGRYWGALEDSNALHFETCYYQGISYAIEHKLQVFEPGAQGEHKIARGFLPSETYSAHWIPDPAFRDAIARFLVRERDHNRHYWHAGHAHSPYRDKQLRFDDPLA